MKIGLLECDHVAEPLRQIAGDYRDMFRVIFPGIELEIYDVCNGQFPASAAACEAYVCTGSRFSVYDPGAWIAELKSLVQGIYRGGQKFVGVCFGHQMLGEALGGKVEKAASGWNVGVHRFDILRQEAWMDPFQTPLQLLMSCQDQVIQLPENSTVLAAATNCPVGMFRVGEHMLGIQAHPEFPKEYARRLMEFRRDKIGPVKVAAALESLNQPVHSEVLAHWMTRFLTGE